ncbi:hypothetical protein FisN_22Lh090 [Fistulifera solaris]|uniref:START domain-containing protein n=1 Tax=Fistulifera solaris TaxID=1519565 RepID=A0A1Z5JBZ8_FISSO|nr:hypothetical protein FisN_22Lh090 [Fistulifera solaris]|eukprot:GAX11412.1 hypothetical protein FisN_22Lh090 [Fistulifera solaris]
MSLGSGGLTLDCEAVESFSSSNPPSPTQRQSANEETDLVAKALENISLPDTDSNGSAPSKPPKFIRSSSSFLRVSDLNIEGSAPSMSSSSETLDEQHCSEDSFPNFHHPAADPPPGVSHDPREQWIALDNGDGCHAPIAPFAVAALVQSAHQLSGSASKWTPDASTAKWIEQNENGWDQCTWKSPNDDANGVWKNFPQAGSAEDDRIFVWSTTFSGGGYGSEIPAVRVAGIVPTSAKDLMQLLVDSNRVHEYNKLSLGRTDELILQESLSSDGPFGGITKVMTSQTTIMRKTLQFTSLMHARETEAGYKLVTRAVESPFGSATALKSEILLGINVIWRIPGDDRRCLLIAVNHIRSPFVPMMIAKRIGLQAATNFINDIRQCCRDK